MILALISIVATKWDKRKAVALILISVGTLFALGPYLIVNSIAYEMPLYPVYKFFNLQNYLRIPPRAFTLVILGIALLISLFFAKFSLKKNALLSLVFAFMFFFENVPQFFLLHNSKEQLALPEVLKEMSWENPLNKTTVAFLPSSILSGKVYNQFGVSEFSREHTYAYWQTIMKVNIINGSSSFFPESRLLNNELLQNLEVDDNLNQLIMKNSIDFIVLIKNPIFYLTEEEENQKKYLLETLKPLIVSESKEAVVFKTTP